MSPQDRLIEPATATRRTRTAASFSRPKGAAAMRSGIHQDVTVDRADVCDAGERHRHTHLSLNDLHEVRDSILPACSQCVDPRAAEHYSARSQREHADDVETGTHAAIRKDGEF